MVGKRKRRVMFRRKRTLDPGITIDYKHPDILKRFITDRGKIIPRRISGATAKQQREICKSVKRARYLGLLPFSVAHRGERGFANEMTAIAASLSRPMRDRPPGPPRGEGEERSEKPPTEEAAPESAAPATEES